MIELKKSEYFRILKDAGVQFDKHYRNYTKEELREAIEAFNPELIEEFLVTRDAEERAAQAAPPVQVEVPTKPTFPVLPASSKVVYSDDPLDAYAGMRLNDEYQGPIRIDSSGRQWLQEEIRKPSFPKARARRKLQYIDSGVQESRVKAGDFTETFEVAGNESRASEVKITLPSYQVGVYKDPRFPFLIHVYNEQMGFDLFEVQDFYGGPERVPEEIKKVYIENVLCFDVRTTIRAIETEAREKKLDLN